MATVAEAKTVIEILAGKSLTNARIVELVNDYNYDPANDTDNLPNEAKATLFVDALKEYSKFRIRQGAQQRVRDANDQSVIDAGDNATSDF